MIKPSWRKSKIVNTPYSGIIDNCLFGFHSWFWCQSGINKIRNKSYIGYNYSSVVTKEKWLSKI